MDVEKWIAALPAFVTVIAGVSAGVIRLASARSRRFDRVAQLSSAMVELQSGDPLTFQAFKAERNRLVTLLTDTPALSKGQVALVVAMGLGTMAVITSSVLALYIEGALWALILFVAGAVLAVTGVIGGFISGDR